MRSGMGWAILCGLILSLLGTITATAASAGEPVRYTPKAGQQAIYEVNIEATLPDSVEARTGQITYECKSVDADTGQVTLSCSSQLQAKTAPKPQAATARRGRGPAGFGPPPMMGPPPGMMGPPPGFGTPGRPAGMASEVVIDSYGAVVSTDRLSDSAQLPFLLGYDWSLLIEPLSAEGQKTWKSEREIAVTSKADSWPPLPPFAAAEKTARNGKEVTTYTLTTDNGDAATIRKVYNLNVPQSGGSAGIQQSGQGQFVLSRQAGLITSLDMTYTIRTVDKNVTVTVPVKVKARLLSDEEAARFLAGRTAKAQSGQVQAQGGGAQSAEMAQRQAELMAQAQAAAARARAMAGQAGPMPPAMMGLRQKPLVTATPAEVDAALRDLSSGRQPAWVVCQRLAIMKVLPERQKAVINALTPLVKSEADAQPGTPGFTNKQQAIVALGAWGTANEVPLLAPIAADDSNALLQQATIEALGRIGTPEAAEAIVPGMYTLQLRAQASMMLRSMGSVAEPAVIGLLKDRDAAVRAEACRILGAIGTKQSVKPIQDLLAREKGNSLAKVQAEQALQAIEKRPQ